RRRRLDDRDQLSGIREPDARAGGGARMSIVIAVDGTAASGKGTLAKKLARHFAFAHLDSGSLYRLVALAAVEAGGDPARAADARRAGRAGDAPPPRRARA